MRNELNAMIQNIQDPEYKKVRSGLVCAAASSS